MGWSVDATLTFGFDAPSSLDAPLYAYLTRGAPSLRGQHLSQIGGDEVQPHGLLGSQQAGSVRVYVGLIRKASPSDVLDWLIDAPWATAMATLVLDDQDFDMPEIYRLSRDGALQVGGTE